MKFKIPYLVSRFLAIGTQIARKTTSPITYASSPVAMPGSKPVGMKPDVQKVDAEPRPHDDDDPQDAARRHPQRADETPNFGVKNNRAP